MTTSNAPAVQNQNHAPGPARPPSSGQPKVSQADTTLAAVNFAQNIASRLAQFHRLVPSGPNPDLVNRFVEEQVHSLIADCLTPKRLLSGTFGAPGVRVSTSGPPFIEGAVHDPQRGPIPFEQGRFSIVNPATCVGVIQIKPSAANISKFQDRLREIAQTYFFGCRPGTVMGVLVSDPEPRRKSIVCRHGKSFPAYQFTHPKWCPIFILFSRRDGLYEPHSPAIEALLANISRML